MAARLWATYRVDFLIVGAYALVTVLVTFPLAFQLGTRIYGPGGDTDSLLQIWAAWWRKYTWLNGLDYKYLTFSQAPFGTDNIKWFFRPGYTSLLALLAIPFGELAAYNLTILGALVLSSTLTYFLAYQLTANRWASLVAGFAFGFSSFAMSHIRTHGGLSQQWVLPLFALALLHLRRTQTWRAAALLGVSFTIALDVHGYYGYFVTIVALSFAAYEGITHLRQDGWQAALNRRRIGLYALAVAVGVGLYLPVLLPAARNYVDGVSNPLRSPIALQRDTSYFFWMSSRPWHFVIPSSQHPLFGDLSRRAYDTIENINRLDFAPPIINDNFGLGLRWFWRSAYEPKNELYLGIVNLALAGYAIIQVRKGAAKSGSTVEPGPRRFWMGYFGLLFVVALLFSAPPLFPVGAVLRPLWEPLHNVVIPMPSLLTLALFPPLRATSFFVVPAMLALAMWTAWGLDLLLKRVPSRKTRAAIMLAVVSLLAVEYARVPISARLTVPQEHRWLAEQPRNTIVAAYPYASRTQAFYQITHQLPLIDSPWEDPLKDNIFQIESAVIGAPNQFGVAPKLAALGARYVVNGDVPLNHEPAGLELLFESDTAQVYEVTAEPAPLVVTHTFRDGLWVSGADWSWQGETFNISIWNPLNDPVALDVELVMENEIKQYTLIATRTLTPLPQEIVWSGTLIANPLLRPPYPNAQVEARSSGDGLVFEALTFQSGETTLALRWSIVPDGGSFPAVSAVRFARAGLGGD